MSDLPDWYTKPPLSPTERLRLYGSSIPRTASDILTGPSYDARAHYRRVKALYDAYPYREPAACDEFTDRVLGVLLTNLERRPNTAVLAAFRQIIDRSLSIEGFYQPKFDHKIDNPPTPNWISVVVRPDLTNQEQFFLSAEDRLKQAAAVIVEILLGIVAVHAPEPAFVEITSSGSTHVSFIELARTPAELLEGICAPILGDTIPGSDDFALPELNKIVLSNFHAASGYIEGSERRPKVILPTESDLPLIDRAPAYLKDTPFLDLLLMPMPFVIPEETRFAGHWVIAPPGRGKTVALHHLFLEDLSKPASLIVLDSKGDLINPLRKLKNISDRLVIIEPDEDYPLALNPLDIPKSNIVHTIALLEYVFSALLEAKMTALQSTLFRYVLPAIIDVIPNPTLMDFRNVIENGFGNYRANFGKLQPLNQQFFEKQFDSKTYADTRHQLIWRLDFLLTNPLMRAMFEAPSTKIDIGKEMDAGKIILINNSKELLGEEGAEFFGRFFIALVLAAAQQRSSRKQEDKLPCYFYIDECQTVIRRDTKIATILDECRSQKIGLILAHQRTEQIKDRDVLSALFNCAIRYANSDDEAKLLAPSLRTTPEFLWALPRGTFAAYVRDFTQQAVSLQIPFRDLSKLPQLSSEEQRALRARMREQFCFTPETRGRAATSFDPNQGAAPRMVPVHSSANTVPLANERPGADPGEPSDNW
jgi:hypothetical protein